MPITAISSSNYNVQPNPDNNQNVRLTVTENGDSKTLELGYGTDFEVLSVVKAHESDFSPYNSSTYPSSMGMGDTQLYYWVAYRSKNSTSDTQAQFKLKSFDANSLMGSSNWGREYYGIQPSKVEPFFGVDLNGDGLSDGTVVKTAVSTDTAGTGLKIDADGMHYVSDEGVDYAIAPRMGSSDYKFDQSYGTYSRQAIAVEQVASSSVSDEYLLVVKSTGQGSGPSSGNSSSQVSWEVYTLRTQQGWTDHYNSTSSNTGTAGTTGSGGYSPPMTTPGSSNTQSNVPTLYFDWEVARPSTISSYEVATKLNQDLDNDGAIGIPLQSLTAVSDKRTTGLRLEKDGAGNIYIVEGSDNSKTAKSIDNLSSVHYSWGDNSNFHRSSIKEIAAVTEKGTVTGKDTVVGYKLAVKNESSYNMYSGAASSSGSGNNQSTTYISWDVLYVDAQNPKINWGQWDTRQNKWVDLNERNLKSIADYEDIFEADLNDDGRIGLDISSLTVLTTDTYGAKLARAADNGLYVILANGTSARPIKADWLETSYQMDANNYNKREAIAIETILTNGTLTGYRLLIKNSNKWGDQPENVSYDIMRLDASAKMMHGEMSNGVWINYSTYGIKSLEPYELDFGQDFNNDGFTGINVASLTSVSSDITGIRLAKDSAGGYYLVENGISAKAITDVHSLEWSYGTDTREAVAAEAVRNGNTITGYKVAVKQTRLDYYTQRNETTWEIINLDANGKANYGMGAMASGGQIKSIAAYETDFGQDLNNDNRIGIDTSTLTFVSTDTAGEKLAKDRDGAIYIVSGSGNSIEAKPVGNSAWMEYSNSWTGGYNSREVLAVQADKDNSGALLGYKLMLRNTNAWSGSNGEQITYDVLYLNTSGEQQYGTMVNNVWVDKNTYGVKSLLPYEVAFGEDFNADGVVGIDINRLTEVSTDLRGVRLRRDSDNALYLIDEAQGSSPKAIGNAGWLEYSNSWGNGSFSRVAVGIGSTKDAQNTITGYKLALKTTNTWDTHSDVNWEILSLDAEGKVSWGTAAAGTGSVWTSNIRPFETLVDEDLDGDGVIGVDRSTLTVLITDSTSDGVRLAKDSNGQVFILDGSNLTLALRDSNGSSSPSLEYNRSWTDGASTAVLHAAGKDSAGNYKLAVKLTQTTGSKEQVSWQIHTVSSEGVLNWSQMATVRSPSRFETVIGQDLDGDGRIGQGTLQLTDVVTDTGSFKLQKDAADQLYIYDAVDNANNHVTYVVDARGGSPNFDVTLTGYTARAHAVHKQADGSYRLAVKKTTTTGGVEVVKWDVYTLSARNTSTHEATIDWSKTAFSRDPLEVERLINQDVNGDNTVASARVAPSTALGSDLSTTVTVGRDAESFLWIKDGNTWKEVKDLYGTGVKLDATDSLDDGGSFVTETVAATVIAGNAGTSSYSIAVKETLTVSANATPSVKWKIYTVATDGTIDLNPVVTRNIGPWESSTRFNQDLDGVTTLVGDHESQDPDLAADQLGGIYLKNGNDNLLITDGQGGAPLLEYEQLFDGGQIVAKVVAAANEGTTMGDKLLAVEVTTTQDGNSARYWIVHTAEYQDAGTPTDSSDDHYTLDWAAAVITSDMSDYTTTFGQTFAQPTPATLGA